MRHVHQQRRVDLIGDVSERGEVDSAGVRRSAGDDEFGPGGNSDVSDLVVIEEPPGVDSVVFDVHPLAGNVGVGAVAEMTPGRQVHRKHSGAGLEEREEHREVGLGTRVGLHVGVAGGEEFLGTFDGQAFDLIGEGNAPVVPGAGIALDGLVHHGGSESVEGGPAHEVLRGDQIDALSLACCLTVERGSHLRIDLSQRSAKIARIRSESHGGAARLRTVLTAHDDTVEPYAKVASVPYRCAISATTRVVG